MNVIKFPSFVYRCPGAHQCPGGTYDHRLVKSVEDLEAAASDGWWPTLPLAMDPPKTSEETAKALSVFTVEEPEVEKKPEPKELEDETPVEELDREQLEARARLHEIGFNRNTKDETLIEKIKAAEAEE